MRKIIFPSLFAGLFSFFLWNGIFTKSTLIANEKVEDLLVELGETPMSHQVNENMTGVSVEKGKALFLEGITSKPGGGRTRKQSRHFVCTSCHNIQKEDPDLRVSDPQARLEYARDNKLPFLQGTALYGVVNRNSFYNGYYEEKYGDLVAAARNDLRGAIQLCAVECAQGRPLEDWEMESVLAYLWTLGLEVKDLKLSASEMDIINKAKKGNGDKAEARALLKSKYLDKSPATFLKPPEDRKVGYEGIQGDPENGKLVYDLSCLHCHEEGRYAFFVLDDSKDSFKYLKKHIDRYSRYSLYQVARYGTSPLNGKRTYMPNYMEEKLTNQQLEDLRAYIEQRAGE